MRDFWKNVWNWQVSVFLGIVNVALIVFNGLAIGEVVKGKVLFKEILTSIVLTSIWLVLSAIQLAVCLYRVFKKKNGKKVAAKVIKCIKKATNDEYHVELSYVENEKKYVVCLSLKEKDAVKLTDKSEVTLIITDKEKFIDFN